MQSSRNIESRRIVLISLIIPAYNEARLLPGTLGAVHQAAAAWHRRGWSLECIVCDNASTDATPDVARSAGARVLHEPVRQIARARNSGAAVANGAWLVFLDADSQPCPRLFDGVAEAIASGTCLAGGSTLRLDSGPWAAHALTRGWNRLSRLTGWMAGAFIFVESAAFRQAGGFNEQLYASEEIDLARRLRPLARASGRRMVILTHAPLLTSGRKTRLYKPSELAGFALRAIIRPRATLTRRDACAPWYDGRR